MVGMCRFNDEILLEFCSPNVHVRRCADRTCHADISSAQIALCTDTRYFVQNVRCPTVIYDSATVYMWLQYVMKFLVYTCTCIIMTPVYYMAYMYVHVHVHVQRCIYTCTCTLYIYHLYSLYIQLVAVIHYRHRLCQGSNTHHLDRDGYQGLLQPLQE